MAKLWQSNKYDAGWACIGWDPYGGRGASAIEQVIGLKPSTMYLRGFFVIGQGMMAPTLMAYHSHSTSSVTYLSCER